MLLLPPRVRDFGYAAVYSAALQLWGFCVMQSINIQDLPHPPMGNLGEL